MSIVAIGIYREPSKTYLTFHGISVNLTHVFACVLLLYVLDVEIPCVVIGVGHADTGVVCDHVVVDGLDRLGVGFHPSYLQNK